jgi:tetratricopeptide (TPR) repeat protein
MRDYFYIFLVTLGGYVFSQTEDTLSQEDYKAALEHYNQGTDLYHEKKYKEALPLLRHATRLNPYNSDYLFALSNTQNALGQLDSAVVSITLALDMEINQSDYLMHRANILFKMKEYRRAATDYTAALKFQADTEMPIMEEHAFFNRGNCWLYLEEYAKARADFDKAIALGYDIANVYHNRATALIRLNLRSDACKDFRKAVELGSTISGKYVDKYCQ